ncbi:MAG TPA: heme o synthase [Spirochaetia bacterium]|nr:heme o synthase [Spirochaetia bacterium]
MSEQARAARKPQSAFAKVRAYADLTKPRIALLVLTVAVGSFVIASPRSFDWLRLAETALGVCLLAFGIFALNHYCERDSDARMLRTARRPLPSGRLAPREALVFGSTLTTAAVIGFTALLGLAAGAVALFTFISYIFIYTPLKRRTMHHTIPGALSGAMPPLLGWASARGTLDLGAWVLFGILFFWQFPHFLALELMYREDYHRGGIRVITAARVPVVWFTVEILLAVCLLVAVSFAPFFLGVTGPLYLVGVSALGIVFAVFAGLAAVRRDQRAGRLLLRVSVTYLPLVFLLLLLSWS